MENEVLLITENLQLGEGCIWDEERNKIHFVDIEGFKIYSYSLEGGELEVFNTKDYVGSIVLDKKGRLIAAVGNKLLRIDLKSKRVETILTIDQPEYVRFNDGKCDRFGNLWVGTMATDQGHPKALGAGSLYCIKDEEIIGQYSGFTISNGLAWNEEGTKFYHIDTKTQRIDVYEVKEEGVITGKRTLVSIPKEEGSPDGMSIDACGRLWVALWGGGKVNCYDSSTGEKLREIRVPRKNVSCCTFGGKNLDTLFITTAQDEEYSGALYKITLPGVKGTAAYSYGTGIDNFIR